jgi:hypothetical protein
MRITSLRITGIILHVAIGQRWRLSPTKLDAG